MSQNLNLLNSEILATVATVAGISRDPSLWSAADKSDMRQAIRRGLRKFYQPQPIDGSPIHQWRFLERKLYMSAETDSPYSTGTLAISGTATLIGGTWPSWAASSGMINANGHIYYITGASGSNMAIDNTGTTTNSLTFGGGPVTATSTSGSKVITISGAYTVVSTDVGKTLQITGGTNFIPGQYTVVSVDTAASKWTLSAVCASGAASGMTGTTGVPYTLYRYRYPLPADFAEFIGAVTYSNGNVNLLLKNVSDEEIRLRYTTSFRTGSHVAMYSIQHGKSGDADIGATGEDPNKWYISFWPTFESGSIATGIYRASPLDNLDASDITAAGTTTIQIDAVHAETLMAAILSAVDEIYNDRMDGVYHDLFLTRLATSIAHDRHSQGNRDFGGPGGYGNYPGFNARAYSLLYHVPSYDVIT